MLQRHKTCLPLIMYLIHLQFARSTHFQNAVRQKKIKITCLRLRNNALVKKKDARFDDINGH